MDFIQALKNWIAALKPADAKEWYEAVAWERSRRFESAYNLRFFFLTNAKRIFTGTTIRNDATLERVACYIAGQGVTANTPLTGTEKVIPLSTLGTDALYVLDQMYTSMCYANPEALETKASLGDAFDAGLSAGPASLDAPLLRPELKGLPLLAPYALKIRVPNPFARGAAYISKLTIEEWTNFNVYFSTWFLSVTQQRKKIQLAAALATATGAFIKC